MLTKEQIERFLSRWHNPSVSGFWLANKTNETTISNPIVSDVLYYGLTVVSQWELIGLCVEDVHGLSFLFHDGETFYARQS